MRRRTAADICCRLARAMQPADGLFCSKLQDTGERSERQSSGQMELRRRLEDLAGQVVGRR